MAENGYVSRAHVEQVYEAEFRLKAQRTEALPKYLETAGLITLTSANTRQCHAHLKKELIRVELAEMPYLQITVLNEKDFSIIKPCMVPEPCQKHPYQMILPNEYTVSTLPITKIHRELAKFALENDTNFIASENALTCLTQWSRAWRIPLSICDTIGPDGKRVNVLVLDSEFSVHREAAPMRTYKAFRHLLEQALKPSLKRERIYEAPTGQNTDVDTDDEDYGSSLDTDASVESAAKVGNLNISPNVVYVFGSPKAESGSPKAEMGLPDLGLVVPNARFVPKNVGFVSPVSGMPLSRTRFGAPKPMFYSPSDTEDSLQSPAYLYEQASTSSYTSSIQVPNVGLRNCTCTDASAESGAKVGNLNISPNVVYMFGSPKAESGSPKAEIDLPDLGLIVPNARFVPKNVGFMSPVSDMPLSRTRFGAPKPMFYSPSDTEDSLQSPAHLYGQASTSSHTSSIQVPKVGLRNCTCTDTSYSNLPFRSFRKWLFCKEGTAERLEIIVHSSHKGKDLSGELLLEPQPDIGANAPSPDAVRRAAMSLALNKPASLLNVRLNGPTGKVENFEKLSAKAFAKRNRGAKGQVINTILAVLGQLQDLKPGHYVLQHEANHGTSAMLLAPRSMRTRYFDTDQPMEGARVANLSSAVASMQPSTSGA